MFAFGAGLSISLLYVASKFTDSSADHIHRANVTIGVVATAMKMAAMQRGFTETCVGSNAFTQGISLAFGMVLPIILQEKHCTGPM